MGGALDELTNFDASLIHRTPMLLQEGQSRTTGVDLRLAVSLAAVAGAINAASFKAVGFFSANMTGNVSSLSDHVALGDWAMAATFMAIVAAFILGSFSSTILIETGRRRGLRGVFAYSILVEGLLLAALGVSDLVIPAIHTTSALIVGLSFLMGLQNATSTLISNARVRTTHVSGMATDLGIEGALLVDRAASNKEIVRARFVLHGTTLIAFLLGGVIGVLGYASAGDVVFIAVAAILIVIAAPFISRLRSA